MPKVHFYHDNIHLAIDEFNGEILAIRDLVTGDNLIKNTMCCDPETYVYQPFTFKLNNGETETEYHPLYSREPLDHPVKRVKITSEEMEDGLLVKVSYNCVTSQIISACSSTEYVGDSSKELRIEVFYTVHLSKRGLKFTLHIDNSTDETLTEVRFPVIGGVFLGNDHRNNVLVYPRTAGVKNENPIEWFDRKPNITHWRWNEYRYIYTDGLYRGDPPVHERGMRGYAGVYPGQLSMSWMDLYNDDGGFYYGVHNEEIQPVRLECATYGRKCIGLNFASNFPVRIASDESYTTPPTHLIFHDGDWHEGASIYRSFRFPLIPQCGNIMPSWAKDGVALTAHYDFKLQDGTWHHTFKDIPQLARDSKSMGVNHMLLSGWNQDGFDNGYPLYYPDSDLGTEEEFIQGIKEAKQMGVHISLYQNSQLYNLRYDKGDVAQKVVLDEKGNMATQSWGINKLAVMCAMSEEWQDEISANVKRATQKYGVDGIYFDQFCNYRRCYSPNHQHIDPDWITARLHTVMRCREEYKDAFDDAMMTMGEWVCDAYGGIMTYQLTQSFFSAQMGFFTDMYRYTFPEFGLMDMVYPKNVLMRPPQFAAREEILATCFTNGSYLWLYHISDDINFFRDAKSLSLIQNVNQMNTIMKLYYDDFRYVDSVGVSCDESVARVRRYNNGKQALIKAYRYSMNDAVVDISENIRKATLITSDNSQLDIETTGNAFILPKEKCSVILLEIE